MAERHRDDDDRPRRSSREDDERGSRGRDRDDDRGSSRGRDRDEDRGSSRRRDDDDDEPKRGGGRGGGYTYERRDAETARKRAENGPGGDFDRIVADHVKQWKPNDGDNRIRIMPPTWKKPEHYGYDLQVHYGVGADRGSYLCLHKHKGEADPIYEAYERTRQELNENEGDKDLEKLVKDLKAKKRVGVYLVDRDHEKDGVQFWAMPAGLDMDIVQVMQDKRTGEVLNIDDPEDGYDVEFRKNGKGINTEYIGVAIARRSSPLGRDGDKWMEYVVKNPIPDVLKFYDYDHIAKAFGGGGSKRRRDDDDDRGGSSSRGRDRGRDEERDQRPSRNEDRGRSRDDDDRGGRSRSREDDEPTWASIHDMTRSEMVDLIEQNDKLSDVKPKQAKDDEDLADWICEELRLKKPKAEEREERGRGRADDEDQDKLAEMRRRRERS